MRPLKVLLVSNMYPSPDFPSYGVFVENAAKALAASTVQVERSVIFRQSRRLAKLLAYFKFIVVTAYRYHFKQYDVVYVHYISHSFLPLLFSGIHRKNKIVVHVHGGDVVQQEEVASWYFRLKSLIARQALKRADEIIVPSRYYKKLLCTQYLTPADHIQIVASGGVDRNIFNPRIVSKSCAFTVGYVGRLDHGKGVETLIRALVIASEAVKHLECVVVGDGQLREQLEQLAESLGLSSKIEFCGTRAQGDLPELLSAFDVFAFPTERKSESLGLVGLEAMACGIPVIGSDLGGLRDYVQDGVNGFFFEPGDISDLADKIERFHELTAAGKSEMSAAAERTAARFDADGENEKLLRILGGIADAS